MRQTVITSVDRLSNQVFVTKHLHKADMALSSAPTSHVDLAPLLAELEAERALSEVRLVLT